MKDGAAMKGEFSRDLGRAITHINRMRKRYMASRLAEYGLGGALYMYMLAIGNNPGQSQDFLVNRFCADKGNVARAAGKLEDMGYLRREASPDDRRQNRLYLTEKGEALMPVIGGYLAEWGDLLTKDLSDEEVLAAHEMFKRLEQNAKDVDDAVRRG